MKEKATFLPLIKIWSTEGFPETIFLWLLLWIKLLLLKRPDDSLQWTQWYNSPKYHAPKSPQLERYDDLSEEEPLDPQQSSYISFWPDLCILGLLAAYVTTEITLQVTYPKYIVLATSKIWIENNILHNPKSLVAQLNLFPYECITFPFPPVFNLRLVDSIRHP